MGFKLQIDFLKTKHGFLKILECILIIHVVVIARFGGEGSSYMVWMETEWTNTTGEKDYIFTEDFYKNSSIASRENQDLTFLGIGTCCGFAIIVPAMILSYLLGVCPSTVELIVNLVGGILFIIIGLALEGIYATNTWNCKCLVQCACDKTAGNRCSGYYTIKGACTKECHPCTEVIDKTGGLYIVLGIICIILGIVFLVDLFYFCKRKHMSIKDAFMICCSTGVQAKAGNETKCTNETETETEQKVKANGCSMGCCRLKLHTDYLRTGSGKLKLLECILILNVLLLARFGGTSEGQRGFIVAWETDGYTFLGMGTCIGFAIIVPAILLTHLLRVDPSALEFIINLAGGILYIAVGVHVESAHVADPVICNCVEIWKKKCNDPWQIKTECGTCIEEDVKVLYIILGIMAIILGIIFLIDFLNLLKQKKVSIKEVLKHCSSKVAQDKLSMPSIHVQTQQFQTTQQSNA